MAIEALQIWDESPLVVARERIQEMLSCALNFCVTDEQGFRSITALYAQAREMQKLVESKRKEAIEPSRKVVNSINDRAKQLLEPLAKIIDCANQKAQGYQVMLQAKKKAEIEEAAALLELSVPTITPIESIRGEGATTYTKTVKRFRVADQSKVPAKYLMVNSELIEKDIKLGINSIPGIEIYEETTTSLRRR